MKLLSPLILAAPIFSTHHGHHIKSRQKRQLPNFGNNNSIYSALRASQPDQIVGNNLVWSIYAQTITEAADYSDDKKDKMFAWVMAVKDKAQHNMESIPDKQMLATQLLDGIMGEDTVSNGMRGLNCAGGAGCTLPLNLELLYHYGCWCNLGDKLTHGQGNPVDIYDESCKRLQLCARCAVMDSQEECDAGATEYTVAFSFNPQTNKLVADCDLLNNSDCEVALCMCEIQWLNEILNIGFDSNIVDDDLNHNSPNFDKLDVCGGGSHGGGNGGDGDGDGDESENGKDCCGAYPFRYPFKKAGMECCDADGNIFSPAFNVCCDDGVKDLGSGCGN